MASAVPSARNRRRILVIDVGGTNIKVAGSWRRQPVKTASGPTMTASQMVQSVRVLTEGWDYDVISIGYPGPVRHGRPAAEPVNIGGGWRRMDFERAFGKPVRLINDAAMQALGSYEGGRMLFLGLGTGLGNATVEDGHVQPLELGHLPYRRGKTYEDYLGTNGLKAHGRKRWAEHLAIVTQLLREALLCDYVMLGGGNVNRLRTLPPNCRRGTNANAVIGGIRLWK